MIYDEGQAVAEPCPNCGSTETYKDGEGFGYWKCESCSTVWGLDEDDPDYDDGQDICPTCSGDRMVPTESGYDSCPTCGGVGVVEHEPGILAAGALVDAGLYAALDIDPPLPQRKFEFGDLVVVDVMGATGEVVGIWWKDEERKWKYRLRVDSRDLSIWWPEEKLLRPSEFEQGGDSDYEEVEEPEYLPHWFEGSDRDV